MKTITLAMLGIGLLVFSGCASPKSDFVPPGGALFASYKAPLLVRYDDAAVSSRGGDASAKYAYVPFTYGMLSFAWDDCSLDTAVKDGRFNRVGTADYSFFSVLGIYAKTTVHVYEDPSGGSTEQTAIAVQPANTVPQKANPSAAPAVLKPDPVKTQPAHQASPKADSATQLKKLQELKNAGLLTDEEYQTKRKALVGEL